MSLKVGLHARLSLAVHLDVIPDRAPSGKEEAASGLTSTDLCRRPVSSYTPEPSFISSVCLQFQNTWGRRKEPCSISWRSTVYIISDQEVWRHEWTSKQRTIIKNSLPAASSYVKQGISSSGVSRQIVQYCVRHFQVGAPFFHTIIKISNEIKIMCYILLLCLVTSLLCYILPSSIIIKSAT